MTMNHRNLATLAFGIAAAASILIGSRDSVAQRAPAKVTRVRAHRRTRQDQQTPANAVHFGDIQLYGFADADIDLPHGKAVFTGPNTTVDAADPKQPDAKSRLKAREIVAILVPKSANKVERVEAAGSVQFESSRPMVGGAQTFHGTGSKGTFFKQERRLTFEGPVEFNGGQPSADGKGRQSIAGTADSGEYDESKQTLTLRGGVNATINSPELDQPSKVIGDEVQVDMSQRPYRYHIHNANSDGSVTIHPKQSPPKKKPDH